MGQILLEKFMESCNFLGKDVIYEHFVKSLEESFVIFNTLTVSIRTTMKIQKDSNSIFDLLLHNFFKVMVFVKLFFDCT